MATYLELATIHAQAGYGDFAKKLNAAVVIKAHSVAQLATPTDLQIQWAKEALTNPDGKRQQIEYYVYAANKNATVTQILNATDTAIQTAVDGAVDNLLSK